MAVLLTSYVILEMIMFLNFSVFNVLIVKKKKKKASQQGCENYREYIVSDVVGTGSVMETHICGLAWRVSGGRMVLPDNNISKP